VSRSVGSADPRITWAAHATIPRRALAERQEFRWRDRTTIKFWADPHPGRPITTWSTDALLCEASLLQLCCTLSTECTIIALKLGTRNNFEIISVRTEAVRSSKSGGVG